jgi:epoxyqueuosine reductase
MDELKKAIRLEARRLGFDLVGVTTPDPPPHAAVFDAWLDAGRHGEMAYLASERSRQRRRDPRQIMPECRAILVLGIRYPAPSTAPSPGPTAHGQVAAYAWGDDYHEVLPARLQSLAVFIEARVGRPVPHRWYTDTGPLLERDLAQRAGLGWIGKNTCLINPREGSYFLLAEILLGLELEPDPPFAADQCGTCTRCLEACPTACILPDRTLDARRCLSYLTIELKGAIPEALRPALGNWVFGCDICQQVCPWNLRFATPHGDGASGDEAFAPRPGLPYPDLSQELSITPAEFNARFKRSPVRRAKRRGYLRNLAVAAGNAARGGVAAGDPADPSALPALAHMLEAEPEALVRYHAAWALGQVGGPLAQEALAQASRREKDPAVLGEIQAALARLNPSTAH